MTDSSARDALLAALDTRDVQTIQEAMASYADAVQGVQLQSAAFELVARVNEANAAEIDTLIAEMRQLASKNPASMKSLGSPPAMPPPPQPAQIDREPPSPAAAVAPEPSELRVTVHSPELVTSTLLKSHHVYRVEVQAESLSVPTCSVGRRFSDFDWLQLRLREEYPGVVVPPLPEKQGMVDVAAQEVLQASGVQDDDDSWLEQRCTALGRMLRRIYAHPLLGGSPSLQAFLEANDQGFAHFKEEAAALDNKGVEALAGLVSGGGSLLGRQGLLGGLFSWGGPAATPAETDPEGERLRARFDALHLHAAQVHTHGAQCAGQLELRAGALAYLGEALQDVGRQEVCSYKAEETADSAAAYALMARAVDGMASAQAELAHREGQALVAPLGELGRELGACSAAIGAREAALARLNRAAEALAGCRAAFEREKAAGAPKQERLTYVPEYLRAYFTRLRTHFLLATCKFLLTTYYLLLTAYYLLLTTYCVLLTTYCLLRRKQELLALKEAWEEAKRQKAAARAAQTVVAARLATELAAAERAQAIALRQAAVRYGEAQIAHARQAEELWATLRDELVALGEPEPEPEPVLPRGEEFVVVSGGASVPTS